MSSSYHHYLGHVCCCAAVLTVLHGAGWPNHVFWQRWVEAHPPGDVALMVHMKVRSSQQAANVAAAEVLLGGQLKGVLVRCLLLLAPPQHPLAVPWVLLMSNWCKMQMHCAKVQVFTGVGTAAVIHRLVLMLVPVWWVIPPSTITN